MFLNKKEKKWQKGTWIILQTLGYLLLLVNSFLIVPLFLVVFSLEILLLSTPHLRPITSLDKVLLIHVFQVAKIRGLPKFGCACCIWCSSVNTILGTWEVVVERLYLWESSIIVGSLFNLSCPLLCLRCYMCTHKQCDTLMLGMFAVSYTFIQLGFIEKC